MSYRFSDTRCLYGTDSHNFLPCINYLMSSVERPQKFTIGIPKFYGRGGGLNVEVGGSTQSMSSERVNRSPKSAIGGPLTCATAR